MSGSVKAAGGIEGRLSASQHQLQGEGGNDYIRSTIQEKVVVREDNSADAGGGKDGMDTGGAGDTRSTAADGDEIRKNVTEDDGFFI